MRAWHLVLVASAVVLRTEPQDSGTPRTFWELRAAVAASDESSAETRIARFLRGRKSDDLQTLKARLLLASHHLRAFACRKAALQFRAVLEGAPRARRSLIARALYGLAQCDEFLGRIEQSRAHLHRLRREFRDLRHARFAAASILRLDDHGKLVVGQSAPEIRARDVTGFSWSSAEKRGRPVLVMFFAPRDVGAVGRVTGRLRAFRSHGGLAEDAFLFGVEHDVAQLRRFGAAKAEADRAWASPLFPCAEAFLAPVLLDYGVQALPDCFLIGPDGRLLLRSPTSDELGRAMDVLLGK